MTLTSRRAFAVMMATMLMRSHISEHVGTIRAWLALLSTKTVRVCGVPMIVAECGFTVWGLHRSFTG